MYIYALQDPLTNEIKYIGKWRGTRLNDRLCGHIGEARKVCDSTSGKGSGKNPWIKRMVDFHKIKPLIIPIIEGIESDKDLINLEIYMIAFCRDVGIHLLNLTDGGDGAPGAKRSQESIRKQADALRGKKRDPEAVIKTANANRGLKRSDDAKAKMSAAQTGKKRSPEAIAKTASGLRGKKRPPFSDEWRARLSASKMGTIMSDDHKAKISARSKINSNTPKERERMAAIGRANKWLPETRLRVSRAHGGKPFIDDLGNIYQTKQEAATAINCHKSQIFHVLSGKKKSARGRRFMHLDPSDPRYPKI